MAESITFDASDFDHMARKLRAAADRLKHEMQPALVEIATEVKELAKARAGEYSKSIPPTIHSYAVPGAAIIAAGDSNVRIASLFELGNKGAKRSARTFRHPVFGNREVWVTQDKHPFLGPAVRADRPAINRHLERAWERTLPVITEGRR